MRAVAGRLRPSRWTRRIPPEHLFFGITTEPIKHDMTMKSIQPCAQDEPTPAAPLNATIKPFPLVPDFADAEQFLELLTRADRPVHVLHCR